MNSGPDTTRTEPDKGSAEPLSRNMGSHSSLGNHKIVFFAINSIERSQVQSHLPYIRVQYTCTELAATPPAIAAQQH
jgi:hypothetical protein